MIAVTTLSELVNLAIGTPEVGCVNYNALHLLLHGIIAKLEISDAPVQLGPSTTQPQGATDDDQASLRVEHEDWGTWVGSQPSLAGSIGDGGKKEGEGEIGEVNVGGETPGGAKKGAEKTVGAGAAEKGKDKGARGGPDKAAKGAEKAGAKEKSGKEGRRTTGGETGGSRKTSGGAGRSSGEASATDSIPLMVHSMPFHELVKKVEKLEEAWEALNDLTKIDPFGKTTDEKGVPLHDMWETLQFQKRLDANTEGVDRLMGLVQEILHRLQKLADNDAEQMALITGSRQKIASLAPKADFDAVKDELSSIAGKVDSLQEKDGLVTWDNLELALKGSDDLHVKSHEGHEGEKGSLASVERDGSLKDVDEFELVLTRKGEEEEAEEGGAERRDGESGKGVKDKHEHGSGKAGGTAEHPSGKGQESGKVSGKASTGDDGQTESREGSHDDTESRRGSGGGRGPSLDLQSVLSDLGKLDKRFKDLLAKVSGIEHTLARKDILNLSADAVKKMSDGAIAIESTRDQMKDMDDELSRSYLDQMYNANEIIATLRDTAQCQLPSLDKDDDSGPTERKSLALGALEKNMKLIDKTFGVLQRAVQNLDCKLNNQTIKWDEKLKGFQDGGSRPGTGSRHLISSPSIEDESCKDEEPEVADQSAVESEEKLKELERKLGLRKDEMCKMTKRLNQLNKAVGQQLNEAKDRLNDLESRLSEMTCDLKRLLQKIEADRGQYVAPTDVVIDGSGVSLLIGVQNALADLKTDMEKLSGKTDSLQLSNAKHQDSIDNLLKLATDLEEKKTDKADLIEKATKQDMDLKLDSRVFETTCDEMTKNVNSLLNRVSRLDEECKNSFDKLTSDLGGYMTSEEFDRIRDCMAKQFKVLAKKLVKMQKQLEIAKLVGDDAAGIRRQLFKCLSCDRPILMASQEPKPALPARDGLYPYRSTKPYTTYELEQIRQHARCFQIPKGLSNYERAVIERQLSRMKIRDLRGNANPYWKQDHPTSPVKHIRTSAVSPNSQGDAAAATTDDPTTSFPDPYACTRPCGGSHTLTSPYKRVIHMADLNSIIMNDEQSGVQQNQDNNLTSSYLTTSRERSPAADSDDQEDLQTTVTADQDKGHVESSSKSRMETLMESQSTPEPPPPAALPVVMQLSDDSGRRFSDPSINAGVVKKLDVKKSNMKPGDRRISAPNTSASAMPNATYMKKRRFSTPVNMMVREPVIPSAHLKKPIKEHKVTEEEEDVNKDEEEQTQKQPDNQQH